jgi:hypothetical protein
MTNDEESEGPSPRALSRTRRGLLREGEIGRRLWEREGWAWWFGAARVIV